VSSLKEDPIWAIKTVGLYVEFTRVNSSKSHSGNLALSHAYYTHEKATVLRGTRKKNCHGERALKLEMIAAINADMATLGEEGLKTVVTRIVVQVVTTTENKSGSNTR